MIRNSHFSYSHNFDQSWVSVFKSLTNGGRGRKLFGDGGLIHMKMVLIDSCI